MLILFFKYDALLVGLLGCYIKETYMDFTSGLPWLQLNEIIKENFKVFVPQLQEENASSVFPFFQLLTDVMSGKRFMWSGSMAENTFIDPVMRMQCEADIMVMSPDFVISRDVQAYIFEDIPDEPVYVRIEAAESVEDDEVLNVKKVVQSNGRSHFFIVPDLERFPSFSIENFLQADKNILVQSLFDTFQLDNFSWMLQPHGPAFAHSANGFSRIFDVVNQPKKTLFKFLGHLGSRALERLDKNTTSTGELHQDSHNEFKKDPQMIDFVRSPPSLEVMPDIGLMMDICPAIKCEGWPHKALRFFHRPRIWPDDAILNKLLQSGFHLVYKPLNPQSQDSVEWRISFSKAELTLFQNMEAFQVHCYRTFKAIYYCELTLPKVLCSYHMKTIFLWACERIPSEMWVESNLAQIIMGLLDDLLHCLVTKRCPHYFIPENNLFGHVHWDFLDHLAKVVSKIRRNPERYPLVKPVSDEFAESAGDQVEEENEPQNESLSDEILLD